MSVSSCDCVVSRLVTSPDGCCGSSGVEGLSMSEAEKLAGMFKALSDPVRLRLLSRIASRPGGEACVCDIQDVGVSQPTVSHHLRKLREAGLLVSERRASRVYYRLVPAVAPWARHWL
ncbi:helix-turn-helix transcriptional regulator [Streptomyces sp. NBRC 109706]|uniref:ArsR/SmtB family transcription factor n=1 Tax=Streptomyces sp. NBRC 109706 TaxID=1550035 RepID=UPI000781786D|nr:metalloregulator ArsR/SmtB family transcription factor [Streptomyces sp. NBRC 109706]